MPALKRLLVFFGSVLAAAWTVGNIFAIYWAKVYLFDRPALIMVASGTQVPRGDDVKQMVVTLEFENNGIWPYELVLKAKKPITIAVVKDGGQGEPDHAFIKQISLPSVYPGKDGSTVVQDINGLRLSPGEKSRMSVATSVPGQGLYFVEFNLEIPYKSLFMDRIVRSENRPIWITANTYVYIK
jgi:hypothetical protein